MGKIYKRKNILFDYWMKYSLNYPQLSLINSQVKLTILNCLKYKICISNQVEIAFEI